MNAMAMEPRVHPAEPAARRAGGPSAGGGAMADLLNGGPHAQGIAQLREVMGRGAVQRMKIGGTDVDLLRPAPEGVDAATWRQWRDDPNVHFESEEEMLKYARLADAVGRSGGDQVEDATTINERLGTDGSLRYLQQANDAAKPGAALITRLGMEGHHPVTRELIESGYLRDVEQSFSSYSHDKSERFTDIAAKVGSTNVHVEVKKLARNPESVSDQQQRSFQSQFADNLAWVLMGGGQQEYRFVHGVPDWARESMTATVAKYPDLRTNLSTAGGSVNFWEKNSTPVSTVRPPAPRAPQPSATPFIPSSVPAASSTGFPPPSSAPPRFLSAFRSGPVSGTAVPSFLSSSGPSLTSDPSFVPMSPRPSGTSKPPRRHVSKAVSSPASATSPPVFALRPGSSRSQGAKQVAAALAMNVVPQSTKRRASEPAEPELQRGTFTESGTGSALSTPATMAPPKLAPPSVPPVAMPLPPAPLLSDIPSPMDTSAPELSNESRLEELRRHHQQHRTGHGFSDAEARRDAQQLERKLLDRGVSPEDIARATDFS